MKIGTLPENLSLRYTVIITSEVPLRNGAAY